MKTVEMSRDYSFRVCSTAFIQFKAGQTYQRVTEAQASAIVAAGAGKIVGATEDASE